MLEDLRTFRGYIAEFTFCDSQQCTCNYHGYNGEYQIELAVMMSPATDTPIGKNPDPPVYHGIQLMSTANTKNNGIATFLAFQHLSIYEFKMSRIIFDMLSTPVLMQLSSTSK